MDCGGGRQGFGRHDARIAQALVQALYDLGKPGRSCSSTAQRGFGPVFGLQVPTFASAIED